MERTCTTPGCSKPHRARGLCATCYNQQHQTKEQRHPKMTVSCTQCGTPCVKEKSRGKRYGGLFCDVACLGAWNMRQAELRKLPVLYVGPPHVAEPRPVPSVVHVHGAGVWTAGYCARCGTPFLDRQPGARFCSASCNRKYWRKKTKVTSGITNAVRQYVLARDGWRCQICMRMIRRTVTAPHPLSPSIDHVIPQSHFGRRNRAAHNVANLRAAHFLCNSLRGARGGGEQLALFG